MTRLSIYRPNRIREASNNVSTRFLNRFFDETVDCRQYFAIPPANIAENDDEYRIELAVPGYAKSDFNIEVNKNLLEVALEPEEQKNSPQDYILKEFGFNGFERSFRLSEKVDKENIRARYDDGMLVIAVPKKDEMKNRSIEIQ